MSLSCPFSNIGVFKISLLICCGNVACTIRLSQCVPVESIKSLRKINRCLRVVSAAILKSGIVGSQGSPMILRVDCASIWKQVPARRCGIHCLMPFHIHDADWHICASSNNFSPPKIFCANQFNPYSVLSRANLPRSFGEKRVIDISHHPDSKTSY